MIYVASPYTGNLPDPQMAAQLQATRFKQALQFTFGLTKNGYVAFSPIVYYHQMAVIGGLPVDADYWWGMNSNYLRFSEAMFVLHIPGWDQSKGVQLELKSAKAMNIPIVHFTAEGQQIKEN